jgi:hypothetical protein
MRIPKIISKDGHEYILIQQCNKNMYLYKEMIYGYKECFKVDELSLITNKIARGRPPKYR